MILRALRGLAWTLIWLVAVGCAAWATGALVFDSPVAPLRLPIGLLFGLAMLGAVVFLKGEWRKLVAVGAGFGLVLAWWLTLRPSNNRNWQPDVAQTAWAEIDGDVVTLHNVRNCEYRTETDYTPHWETRKVRLSQIIGIDIAVNYWGSPWMAHPIISFQFADAPPVCFSIETRKEIGESYSAIGGIYRQYELIYVVADERDVIRVRTNYRHGEDVYLYRATVTPDHARVRFLDYLTALNQLRDHPRWYNAVTTNCTTSIRSQHAVASRAPWDWRILVNGKGDEMMFERKAIATAGLPFADLKQRSLINSTAQAADHDRDFSRRIREALPK
jgi:Domain of unknown function (DUF4105)